jgi:hypothetical protein
MEWLLVLLVPILLLVVVFDARSAEKSLTKLTDDTKENDSG